MDMYFVYGLKGEYSVNGLGVAANERFKEIYQNRMNTFSQEAKE